MKKITGISIIKPGSNPDVDSDFHTEHREKAVQYVTDLYGERNVANIVTFGTLAAKGAFKAMCTIYEIPFAQAGKITSLIPPPIEGVDCKLEDIFNSNSDRYEEGADFRAATSGKEWETIIEGARKLEGRNKSTGVHPCGIIISDKPLDDHIPLQTRQDDGRVITQWTYPECEDMGLIKMDFLGLDTVDLIQHTVEYIQKADKKAPNMVQLIHGPMNDPRTYKLFQDANTVGVFQFGSTLVRNLLKVMRPTDFNDLAACTAIARPGPMGMKTHIKYADRKNEREEITPIHKDFEDSPLEEILDKTYNLICYQEQIIKIASEIAGMTLQEGDDLRKAMGKKLIEKMAKMKPKFISGGMDNGYSKEAMTILWETIAEFAKYGFNLSHSVAYATNAYQSAWLKTHYPVEFMAAIIAQNVDDKDKTLMYLSETKRMGLKVGTVDINSSDIKVAPDTSDSDYDIIYGFSGVKAVSENMAKLIIEERNENGLFKNVKDVIERCYAHGVANKKIYENLAKAGAFDAMESHRKAIVENIPYIINDIKKNGAKGPSLFDIFGEDEDTNIDLLTGEYPFVEKLQNEADVIGLYLTDHQLSRIGSSLNNMRTKTFKQLLQDNQTVRHARVIATIIGAEKKRKRNSKSILLSLDDNTGYISAHLSQDIIKGIDKKVAQNSLEKFYLNKDKDIPKETTSLLKNKKIKACDDIEMNKPYILSITYTPGSDDNPYSARIESIQPLQLDDNGRLPMRWRFDTEVLGDENIAHKKVKSMPKGASEKFPGETKIHTAIVPQFYKSDEYYEELLGKLKKGEISDELPVLEKTISNKITDVDQIEYIDSGYTVNKTHNKVTARLDDILGNDNYDYGIVR